MELKIIGSSSAGNSYILENNNEALLIELGVNFKLIKQALNFNIKKVAGCLVTHSHKDHCCAVADAMKAGLYVYSTADEFGAMGVEFSHRGVCITKNKSFRVGGFKVLPFDVKHDTPDPVGFLINHPDCGNVLFLTDTYYTPYTFRGLNNIIIECNYSQEIIDQKVREGASPEFLRNRVLKSHMHLATCKDVLKANDLKAVNNIVLIHLSDSNSDSAEFQNEIEKVTGKTVHVADAGVIIPFNKTPF
ncbi:MBL fold metallo-hydrolase [Segetibacter aerophilus]|uniref:MBL fold metallo-hydrolase n=1 Tax=Segetibacter aerophilus TaxID=670293 RepID=A0A512B9T5_9BACT|nr:MBL fold metallo-hydrolase [Segetibacter aerophilus]GEO08724.1 MBL fold metallo-hydrolase [Segetibacter aerophilus]